jgi:hypothetical protein
MAQKNGSIWRNFALSDERIRDSKLCGKLNIVDASTEPLGSTRLRSSHLTRQQTWDDLFESDCDRVTRIKFVEMSRLAWCSL